jgi:hypothetical protein
MFLPQFSNLLRCRGGDVSPPVSLIFSSVGMGDVSPQVSLTFSGVEKMFLLQFL